VVLFLPIFYQSFELKSSNELKVLFGCSRRDPFLGMQKSLHDFQEGIETVDFLEKCLIVIVIFVEIIHRYDIDEQLIQIHCL
jgi:hypothetical protein